MKKSLIALAAFGLVFAGAGCSKAAVNTPPSDPTGGRLIKGALYTTVYYLGPDGKRYVFPNEKTYLSWFGTYSYVKQISDEELIKSPLGGNVTYKPGVRLVKIDTDPRTYVVTRGGVLRQINDELLAESLYGNDWRSKVDDLPDAFFSNYTVGPAIMARYEFSPNDEVANTKSIEQDKGLVPAASTPMTP